MHSNLERQSKGIHEVIGALILQQSCSMQIQIHANVLIFYKEIEVIYLYRIQCDFHSNIQIVKVNEKGETITQLQ